MNKDNVIDVADRLGVKGPVLCHKCKQEIKRGKGYCPVRIPDGSTVAVHPHCMDWGVR